MSFYFRVSRQRTFLHKKFAEEIVIKIGESEDFGRNLDKLLGNLFETNELILDKLEDEEEYNSFKIFGFKIESNSIVQFLIAFMSVAITMYEVLGDRSSIAL